VRVLLFHSVSLPHIEFRQSLARPRLGGLRPIIFYAIGYPRPCETLQCTGPRIRDIEPNSGNHWLRVLVSGTYLYTQQKDFHHHVRDCICHLELIYLVKLHEVISILHGQPNFIQKSCSSYCPFNRCFMCAVLASILL
jgi:hypothetical protein